MDRKHRDLGTDESALEEEIGYESVTVNTSDLDSVYEGVAEGDLDAFQDVWLPNQQDLLGNVEDDVELLDPFHLLSMLANRTLMSLL